MSFDRAINRIDHVERATRGTAVRDVPRSHVKRKEFSRQPALLHALDAGAIRDRRSAAEIVIVVRHRRCYVVVRVDDDFAAMNSLSSPPKGFIAPGTRHGSF